MPNMKPITHQEAQQLASSALGSFSYLLSSKSPLGETGERFTARQVKGRWYVIPAVDKLHVKNLQGEVVEVL